MPPGTAADRPAQPPCASAGRCRRRPTPRRSWSGTGRGAARRSARPPAHRGRRQSHPTPNTPTSLRPPPRAPRSPGSRCPAPGPRARTARPAPAP
eukprot:987138-Rhodomonas_salina.5